MADLADHRTNLTVLEFKNGDKWRLVTTPEELSDIQEQIEQSLTRDPDVVPLKSTGYKQEIPTLTDLVPEFDVSSTNNAAPALKLYDPGFYFEENDRKGVFVFEDKEGTPKALVQLYGIYIDEIAVEYSHENEFAMSALRGEIGPRLLVNRDPLVPLENDGNFSAAMNSGKRVIMNIVDGRLHGSDGSEHENKMAGHGAAYRVEDQSGENIQAYFFQQGVLTRDNGPAVIRHDQGYYETHETGRLTSVRHYENGAANWLMNFENRLLSSGVVPAYVDIKIVVENGRPMPERVEAWALSGRAHREGGKPSFLAADKPILYHENGVRMDPDEEHPMPDFKTPLYVREDGVEFGDVVSGDFSEIPMAEEGSKRRPPSAIRA